MHPERNAELAQLRRAVLLKRLQQQATPSRAEQPAQPELVPVPRDGMLPLSFAQQRLWFLDRLDPDSGVAYQIRAALRLRGDLHRSALISAFQQIVARHEALRTVFAERDGEPLQCVLPEDALAIELPCTDLRAQPVAEREVMLQEQLYAEAQRRFDLARGPLLRLRLWQLDEAEWVLAICQHHIIADGWSMAVLIRELQALYAAACEGSTVQLPVLPIQYADYAHWQRHWLSGASLQSQLGFWREYLAGAPQLLELPLDRPRTAQRSYAGGLVTVELGAELSVGVQALAQRHGATLFMTLLAAWSLLMARLSGQDDVVVGTPLANRSRREVEDLLGFFVNVLALRVRVDGNAGVAGLLAAVKESTLAAFSHAELPFDQVVEALQPARLAGATPLFQTMLALDNIGNNHALQLPGLEIEPVALPYTATHYDLTLSLEQTNGLISGSLGYARDLLDEASAERVRDSWLQLLRAMVESEVVPVARLPLLPLTQCDELRRFATGPTPTSALPVHLAFATWAQRQPDQVAVRSNGQDYSYAEIDRRATGLALRLRQAGGGHETVVGVCVGRGVGMVIAVLGILKAGAAYLPLDPDYPVERLRYLLDDSQASILLAERQTALPLTPTRARVLWLDDECMTAATAAPALPSETHPDSLAYVIYTSGSTGEPKGVLATHRGLANVVAAYRSTFPLRPGQSVLHYVSLSFDAATAHLFLALCSGATLYIHDRHAAGARELGEVLRAERITYVGLPVAVLGAIESRELPDLDYLSTGTEACPINLVQRWGARRRFVNIYGPTEASICSTMSVFDPARDLATLTRPPIGQPLPGTAAYVLDRWLQPVPIGVVGELFVAGAGITRGYLGRPGLSAERFLPDPFATEPGARMYRTGDLARLRADGEFDFIGRRDGQVKLRGFRIELGEIESALRAQVGVRQAAATIWDAGSDDAKLVGYVVAEAELDLLELRAALTQRLPAHMLPSALLTIEQLPLTPNGKLDRSALPRPLADASSAVGTPPQTPTETALAKLWQTLLRGGPLSRDDDFFARGGHSLLATQLIARINRQFAIDLPLKTVFDAPSLQAMAACIDRAAASVTDAAPPMTQAQEPGDRQAPLSFAQQRLWFLEQLSPGDASYHIPGALRLRGQLDVAALRQALQAVQDRHHILRCRIVDIDGVPQQQLDLDARIELPLIEASAAQLAERIDQHIRQPFRFDQAPLLRACLLRLADDDHVLLISLHHIIADGWSLGVLIDEITASYRAAISRVSANLPPLPLQYADFARWQRQWLSAGELDRQLDYWRQQLAAMPPLLELPSDRPRPRERSGRGAQFLFAIDSASFEALKQRSHEERATPFMLCLAAFKLLLARLCDQDDIFVGTLVANRTRLELEPLIGFFVNTLVLRTHVDHKQSFRSLLQQVRQTTLAAYAHQDLPFEHLVEALRPARSLSYSPLFQVLFSMQNAPGGALTLPGLTVETLPCELASAKFDLAFDLKEEADGLVIEVEYDCDLFDRSTIAAWADCYRHILHQVAANPTQALAAIELQSHEHCWAQQQRWQGECLPISEVPSVPAQILAQARRRPQALAYVAGSERLSYAELDRRSNQLARELQVRGVGAESIVGVCLPRDVRLPIAILAIWKAGGAYLPMDPEYPASRLRYMLEDSRAVLLIADPGFDIEAHCAVLDPDDACVSAQADATFEPHCIPGQRAYLIYTSGSTGAPKGVEVDHRALAQHCQGVVRAYGLVEDDRVLHFAALGFDISLDQLLPTWTAGAAAVAREAELWEPRQFAEKLCELDISVADLPSALWHVLAKEWSGDTRLPVHPRLRLFLVGGEAMASDALRAWRKTAYAHVPLLNGYGPTETTITSSGHRCTHDEAGGTVPIGRPFANRRFYVLDAALRLLPPGVPGELYIGGEGLARGYLQLPQQTAAAFLPDPFASDAGARMYRSGDRVRYRGDAALEFLGRVDSQVKLQGHRIELEEVEAALRRLPGVRDAAAAVRVLASGTARLVGYLLGNADFDTHALRLRLSETLPEHFVPSILMPVAELPLHNGKIQRKALPIPSEAPDDDPYVAPRDADETWLAELWAELLGRGPIGVHSDFFALGGHSLLATQLLARLRRHSGFAVSIRQLFDAPTISGLASCLRSLRFLQQQSALAQAADAVDAEREEIEL